MKYLSLFILLILTGCASGPPREKYGAKEGDPVISVATLAASRHGGTSFFVTYANENNECKEMRIYQSDYSVSVPKNRIFSVSASYSSSKRAIGGEEIITSCNVPKISVMAYENAAFAFRFELENSRCSISADLVKREGDKEKIVKKAELEPTNTCKVIQAIPEKK
jgi:hypothetical protein